MKRTFTRLMQLSFLVLLIAGCGGKNKSGSPGQPPQYNPITNQPGISHNTAEVMQALNQWMQTGETSNVSSGVYALRTTNTSGFSFSGSFCFSNCLSKQFPYCFVRNVNGSYGVGNTTSSSYCTVTTTVLTKAANTELVNAVNAEGGTLHLMSATRSGSVYTIYYQAHAHSFNQQPDVVYVIDTALPSVLNPVIIYDRREGKQYRIEYRVL
jgi:hypothetical protein